MRCKACDNRLTPREATRKCEGTGEYPDLCDKCMEEIQGDLQLVGNPLFFNPVVDEDADDKG